MTLDLKLFYTLNNLAGQSYIGDGLIVFFASYLQYFLVAAFFLFLHATAYQKREKFHIFWVTVISVVIARLGITEIIRFFYHRPRPFMAYEVRQLIPESAWSFPSGHSAFFFALAMAVCLYNKKWGAWFFATTVVMNTSRVVAGVHYPSDILGGMIVGVLTAYIVFCVADKRGIE